jgi:hypothetical protein
MSKAQANYIIKSIGIIVNTKLKEQFEQKKHVFFESHITIHSFLFFQISLQILHFPVLCTCLSCQSFRQKYGESPDKSLVEETWGFHGTSEYSIQCIAREGFKHPDELKTQKGSKSTAPKKSGISKSTLIKPCSTFSSSFSKTKASPKVQLLDEGYFGNHLIINHQRCYFIDCYCIL